MDVNYSLRGLFIAFSVVAAGISLKTFGFPLLCYYYGYTEYIQDLRGDGCYFEIILSLKMPNHCSNIYNQNLKLKTKIQNIAYLSHIVNPWANS